MSQICITTLAVLILMTASCCSLKLAKLLRTKRNSTPQKGTCEITIKGLHLYPNSRRVALKLLTEDEKANAKWQCEKYFRSAPEGVESSYCVGDGRGTCYTFYITKNNVTKFLRRKRFANGTLQKDFRLSRYNPSQDNIYDFLLVLKYKREFNKQLLCSASDNLACLNAEFVERTSSYQLRISNVNSNSGNTFSQAHVIFSLTTSR